MPGGWRTLHLRKCLLNSVSNENKLKQNSQKCKHFPWRYSFGTGEKYQGSISKTPNRIKSTFLIRAAKSCSSPES